MDMATKNMLSVQFFPESKGEYTFLNDIRQLVWKKGSVYQRQDIESDEFIIEIQIFSNEPPAEVKKLIMPYLLHSGETFKMNIYDSEIKENERKTEPEESK